MKTRLLVLVSILFCLVVSPDSHAQIPQTLSYQGVLTDNAGKPRPDGNYSFTFRLYTSPTGGTAIWSESKSLSVKSGLFSAVLGEQTPFGPAVKFDQQYWLSIQAENEPELSPRLALTSVGYSFSSLRADTAKIAIASIPSSADTTWRSSGDNVYRFVGNVGIGTTSPSSKLTVQSPTANTYAGYFQGNGTVGQSLGLRVDAGTNSDDFAFRVRHVLDGAEYFAVRGDGNVGIGTTSPSSKLTVQSPTANTYAAYFQGNGTVGQSLGLQVDAGTNADDFAFRVRHVLDGAEYFAVRGDGNVGIGTTTPSTALEVSGTTTTKILAITGGGDLAEPFEISESYPIPKGALVIIDEENPGQLRLSHQAYDKRVAGVISGAGGINPGLTLTQEGVLEGGQNVALSGRVYALATAANGPIKPGDLLTTSEVPGHAMKATDVVRSHGTIIGKAMSSLENGEGLVLVLVNLQ